MGEGLTMKRNLFVFGWYVFWLTFSICFTALTARAGEIYVYAGQFEYPSTDACSKETIASANHPRDYVTCTTAGGKAFAHVPLPSDIGTTERFTDVTYEHTTTAVAGTGNIGYKFCFIVPQDGETLALGSIPANSCNITAFDALPAQHVVDSVPNFLGIAPTNVAGADCDTGSNSCKGRMGILVLERDETVSGNSLSDSSVFSVKLTY